jgi:RNA polymerase sigma factor (sigma-70 family)
VRKNSLVFQEVLEKEEWLIHFVMKKLYIYKNEDDYYQEGLIGLWEAFQDFDESRGFSFGTYAIHKIRGRLIYFLKKSKKHDDRLATLTGAVIETTEDEQFIVPLQLEILSGYCEGLPDNQKRWVYMHFVEGKGQKEIASELGVSSETVKSWRRYALPKIRENAERMMVN